MKLSIESLKQAGAFIGSPVEREITWKHRGHDFTATVYVRELSYHEAVADLKSLAANQDGIALRISSCIVDECGNRVFSPEDITGNSEGDRGPLCEPLTMALLKVIGEVSTQGKPAT